MADVTVKVWLIGRTNAVEYRNCRWSVHPDGDLEITLTDVGPIAVFARGQWQWVESVKR